MRSGRGNNQNFFHMVGRYAEFGYNNLDSLGDMCTKPL